MNVMSEQNRKLGLNWFNKDKTLVWEGSGQTILGFQLIISKLMNQEFLQMKKLSIIQI